MSSVTDVIAADPPQRPRRPLGETLEHELMPNLHESLLLSLTEHLPLETMQEIQDEFTLALGAPVRIVGPDGAAVTEPSRIGEDLMLTAESCPIDVPVTVDGHLLARISAGLPPAAGVAQRIRGSALVGIMADLLADRWNRHRHLQHRFRELTGMFRLAAKATVGRDIREVLNLVTRTAMDILRAQGCSLYLLNENRREMAISAESGTVGSASLRSRIALTEGSVGREVVETRRPLYAIETEAGLLVAQPDHGEERIEPIILCVPLSYRDLCEGVLCVYLDSHRELDWYELNLVQAVVAPAAAAVVGDRLHKEAIRAAELKHHMRMAGEVQRQMIPMAPPAIPGLRIGVVYEPTCELSGDFYDFVQMDGDRLAVVICDVVGKGARASLLMASVRASLRAHAANGRGVRHMIEGVNRALVDATGSGDFATLFCGVIDHRRRRLIYVNAGHCPPLLIHNGRVHYLASTGMILGVDAEASFQARSVTIRSGDVLVAYTDGLTEAASPAGEQFGSSRLARSLQDAVRAGLDADAISSQLLRDVRRFTGLRGQADDLTMVTLEATDGLVGQRRC